jgi:hypothetical protein
MRELPTIGGRSGAHRRERARRPKQRSLAGGAVSWTGARRRGVRWPERCSLVGAWRRGLELTGGGGSSGRSGAHRRECGVADWSSPAGAGAAAGAPTRRRRKGQATATSSCPAGGSNGQER